MRALLLIAAAALALAACGKNDQADNARMPSDNLTADSIVSNDVTAIDAVTGDAANMAADVDMNYGNLRQTSGESVGAIDVADQAGTTVAAPAPPREPAAEQQPRRTTTNAATNAE